MKPDGNTVLDIGLAGDVRACAIPGCAEHGTHRAPVSPRQLSEYIWLCLEHVRAYNGAWDFYAGMSEAEIEAHRRADVTWQRPTWPLGARQAGERVRIRDPFDGLDGRLDNGPEPAPGERMLIVVDAAQRKALAVLDLRPPVGFETVKARYKDLVKRLHPDTNGGDKRTEERLKLVNQAYRTLRSVKTC